MAVSEIDGSTSSVASAWPGSSCPSESCSASGGAQAGERPRPTGPKKQEELTPEEQKQVAELKARDAEVRAHESAHVAAGGQYVRGGASYEYQTGPDGRRYAVGGEVGIDTSPVKGNPKATVLKMQVVQRAALAPANPSGQDRAVASAAAQEQLKAQQESAQQGSGGGGASPGPANESPDGSEPGGKAAPVPPHRKTQGYSNHGTAVRAVRAAAALVDLVA